MGRGSVIAVQADSGEYSRTAREEYPIFSNRLPSFEYSIYECVEQSDFVSGLENPTGLALSLDGLKLFVAERGGSISAIEVETGGVLQSIDTGYTSIGGLAVSPESGLLYFVDMDSNQIVKIDPVPMGECTYATLANPDFAAQLTSAEAKINACESGLFSLTKDYTCEVDATIPNGTLFEQVHTDTGYASDNPDVQSMAGMDAESALLANRTDCEYSSELNFDALLLGGYYCHKCLPRNEGSLCDDGGTCANVQWRGFTCDNEYYVDDMYSEDGKAKLVLSSLHFDKEYSSEEVIELPKGVTYRFNIRMGEGCPVSIGEVMPFSDEMSLSVAVERSYSVSLREVTNGPILLTVDEDCTAECLYVTSPCTEPIALTVQGSAKDCAAVVSETPPEVSEALPEGSETLLEVSERPQETPVALPEVSETVPEVNETTPKIPEVLAEATVIEPEVSEIPPEVSNMPQEGSVTLPEGSETPLEDPETSGEATETLPETSETPPEVLQTLPNSETLPETSETPEVADMLEGAEATEFDWKERQEESSARQVLLFKRLVLLVAAVWGLN